MLIFQHTPFKNIYNEKDITRFTNCILTMDRKGTTVLSSMAVQGIYDSSKRIKNCFYFGTSIVSNIIKEEHDYFGKKKINRKIDKPLKSLYNEI